MDERNHETMDFTGMDLCAIYGTKLADHLANIIDCSKRA